MYKLFKTANGVYIKHQIDLQSPRVCIMIYNLGGASKVWLQWDINLIKLPPETKTLSELTANVLIIDLMTREISVRKYHQETSIV